ncbi:MAG TPA: TonB family protein [Pyrinomonadaceae bacterium]|nr:TonB family protein [Pyrinomonadaceae bacterium]
MICSSCGNSIEDYNRFCPKCGAPVQPPAASAPSSYPPPSYAAPPQSTYGGPTVPPRKSSCGKIILILGILFVLLLGGIAAAVYFGYGWVENKLKTSEPYNLAVTTLKENTEVKEKLGEIQETGFPFGAFSENANGTGEAAFVMSVKGTLASGQYTVELVRSDSKWRIKHGMVRLSNGETISVADKAESDFDPDADNTDEPPPVVPEGSTSSARTISGGVLNSKAISLPQPAYPPIAKQVNASGTVVVQVLVDENGNVTTAHAVSGHPLLQASAVAAARKAKFTPTKLSGKPVKVRGVINYNFAPEASQ